jgi:hypothetical protein
MADLAKFIAERINGGTWEDPQYYTDEQRALWVEHAKVIAAQVLAQPGAERSAALIEAANIAASVTANSDNGDQQIGARSVELAILRRWEKTRSWIPTLKSMDIAPKDRPILVLHDHEADPYQDGKSLTLYAAHYEGLSHAPGRCYLIAVWGGSFDDSTYEYPNQASLPDWWFQDGSEFEIAVNPVGWVDLDLREYL